MSIFIVERYWPGVTEGRFRQAAARSEHAATTLRASGVLVRFLQSTLVLQEETVFCQFDGSSVGAVREAVLRSGVGFEQILQAIQASAANRESIS